MKEVKVDVIAKYKVNVVDDTYYVYVIDNDDSCDFYLQGEQYGVIKLMVGLRKNTSYEHMLDIVKNNLIGYIISYKKDVEE